MAKRYPVKGCKIYIGPAMDEPDGDVDADDFAGVTFTEIKNWREMGAYGDAAQTITDQIIGDGRDHKQKGTRNAGTMQNVFSRDISDPGQQAVVAAERADANYPIKIEWNDRPATGTSPKPTVHYFVALVTTAQNAGGNANVIRSLNATFDINSNIAEVPRSAT